MTPQRIQELGLQRLDLLCGFIHYVLGEDSLAHGPLLLMGYRSIGTSAIFRAHEQSLANLRLCCNGLSTQAALRAAAGRYNDKATMTGRHRGFRFEIDEKTLTFKPTFDLMSDALSQALSELAVAPVTPPHGMTLPDTARDMFLGVVHDGEDKRYAIERVPSTAPAPSKHPTGGRRVTDLAILWSDLIAEANQMDRIDELLEVRRPGNWAQRLGATALTSPGADGTLIQEGTIYLSGLKHLIGLPGAGKTTLLVCLLRYLGTRSIKTAVFFPSIEVCRQYLEDLLRYEVSAGLLVGQSQKTRQTHAFKLAESLATNDELRGFGLSTISAPLFEGVCALPRLTKAPAEAFSVEDYFCRDILQPTLQEKRSAKPGFQKHLCPAWSLCSRNKSARELPNTSIWLGHIRSADTSVPAHTTEVNEPYFELIAREFDVVIFDEADNAQQALDMSGISQLKLSGYRYSFHQEIHRISLQVLAAGANARLRDDIFAQFSLECAEFEKLNITLLSAIHRLDDAHRKALTGLLLTPLRLIGDWLSPKRPSGLSPELAYMDIHARAKEALSFIWESAAIAAFQLRREILDVPVQENDKWRRTAEALGRPIAELVDIARAVQIHLTVWLNAPSLSSRGLQEDELESLLAPFMRAAEPGSIKMLVRLLIAVTITVLSYRRLVIRLDELAKDGVVKPIRVDERCSEDLLLASPENLLGSLSGVRFFTEQRAAVKNEDERDIQIQYVVFSGAPRAFMYRLHEWILNQDGTRSGPAVLLTSATSYFPESPAFHVDVPPSYLLHRPDAGTSENCSRYFFRPVVDKDSPEGEHLRYSGVRSEQKRKNNLQKMAAALLEGGVRNSKVAVDCAAFDVKHGMGRKAAFVVNSYEQCLELKQFIDQRFPAWRERTVAVVKEIPASSPGQGFVTPSMVESLGDSEGWDLLIFPMGALGRGTNVVFSAGQRQRDATIGTLYFLTRPHPSPDDLSFLVSLGAEATMNFDRRDLSSVERFKDLSDELRRARRQVYGKVGHLLRHPLYARSLGELFTPFTANVAVPLLQTIGRAMRNACPAQCFFVDRAWAEKSSVGEEDTAGTSMLVQLRTILQEGVEAADQQKALLFRELYGPFLAPMMRIDGLNSATNNRTGNFTEDAFYSPLYDAAGPLQEDIQQ